MLSYPEASQAVDYSCRMFYYTSRFSMLHNCPRKQPCHFVQLNVSVLDLHVIKFNSHYGSKSLQRVPETFPLV